MLMPEEVSLPIENILDESRDVQSIEMGCDTVELSCTTGKIKVWFGKQTGSSVVENVLKCFSRIDSSFVHEEEIICNYNEIPAYENFDYTLMSYGKARGGYRAIFNIQFSKQNALNHLIERIINELKLGEVNKTFHWNGSLARIKLIYNELKSMDGWNITNIEYKDMNIKERNDTD